MTPIFQILNYMLESLTHTWPYLLITIPIAVAVKMSGASKYINRAFTARPVTAIFLATLLGAFSPLCSCSVIPVIAALLIGGVPLAPVMSFWLASPSMDPEIFFLTVSSLGWDLAIWRLASTMLLSLGGGLVTQVLMQRNWLGTDILKDVHSTQGTTLVEALTQVWQSIQAKLGDLLVPKAIARAAVSAESRPVALKSSIVNETPGCGCAEETVCPIQIQTKPVTEGPTVLDGPSCGCVGEDQSIRGEVSPGNKGLFWKRLGSETWAATTMVIKFMLLAWFLGALIRLYVPETWITSILGEDKPWAIITAAFLGVPVYTSNLAAMPLIGGLLARGMHPAAALAFLISGPITTLPAMSAVWGLVNRKVFSLYIAFSLLGAVLMGYIYSLTL